jgi:uncharacterized BrkB/YihY/UPF0761 family membrane protein
MKFICLFNNNVSTFTAHLLNEMLGNSFKALAVFLVCIFLWTGLQMSSNIHFHKLPDGTIIAHSHPFQSDRSGSPIQSHHHRDPFVFPLVAGFAFILTILTVIVIVLNIRVIQLGNRQPFAKKLSILVSIPDRAPPVY